MSAKPQTTKNYSDQNSDCQPGTVDSYIEQQDIALRPLLQQIRAVIKKAAPQASEKIAWGMPTFWQGKNIIHFAAFKKHWSLYPGDLTALPFAQQLEACDKTKGTIRFAYDQPLDEELISAITRWRVITVTKEDK